MNAPRIPPKTAEKLATPFPKGTRHQAKIDIALPLLGSGLPPSAVVTTLKDKFPEASEKEINDVVHWCSNKAQAQDQSNHAWFRPPIAKAPPPPKPKPPAEHAAWWLSNQTMTQEDFELQTQIVIPKTPVEALLCCLQMLYHGTDNLCIVAKFLLNNDGKARPDGAGRILSRDAWMEYIFGEGVPESRAGAWFRPNPVTAVGTGTGGAITDSDVTGFRYLLVESDYLPLATQFALYSRLKLPIAAVVLSGGISAHAWVRLDCATSEEYDHKARQILSALAPFGFDQANKNPSRLSRLPSAVRTIGAVGDGLQKLLWVNPGKKALTDEEISEFEDSLMVPCVDAKPFRKLVLSALDRYEDLHRNQGKLGVPTGFPTFDRVSGGLKAGGYTLIAAGTGVGKSTISINIINSALKANVGVVLFTLEMSADDITDMMFSLNCNVDRNKFNTGEFTQDDIERMTKGSAGLVPLPLFLEDDPDATMGYIRRRVLSLKAEGRVGLVVVDYAQLVRPEFAKEKREESVATVALELRVLSRQANIPMVVLSQVNDDGKIRESRRLSHEAANVLVMTRKSLTDPAITLNVEKGRKIPANPIPLFLDAIHCRISEADHRKTKKTETESELPYYAND